MNLPSWLSWSNRRLIVIVVGAIIVVSAAAALAPDRQTGESGNGASGYATQATPPAAYKSLRVVADEMAVSPGIAPRPVETAGVTAAEVDQKIIKTASLNLVVDQAEDAARKISGVAADLKGFVQSSSISERGDGTHAGNISVRVPAERFDEALTRIKATATVVKQESVNGQDVTEQYTDLQARLKNAKAQEETYLSILKRAQSVEDILKVQERLGAIRAEIESMQGQLQYMENVTSYSTISVYLEEEAAVRAPTKEFRPLAIVKESVQALVESLQSLLSGLIRLVIVGGGLLLPLALLAWAIYAIAKRLHRR